MSSRSDISIIGCGGGGGKLADAIANADLRFQPYFINSSITDINTLESKDDIDKNYLCISRTNGAGRDREKGKFFAQKYGFNILDMINGIDSKEIWLVSSFGGGSGSSIVSVLLSAIKKMKESGDEFDKTINLIGILPRIDSSDEILNNTLDTWNEIMSYEIVNNMIFIDNNNTFNGRYLSEEEINENFAQLFDSIFEIPIDNGRNFDAGNLSRVLTAQGCTYIYNLPDNCTNVDEALKQAVDSSVLAKMFKSKENSVIDPTDGKEKIRCSFVGTSFNKDEYKHEDILSYYKWDVEEFTGYNQENNIVILSGCLPPLYSIQVIKAELDDRKREKEKEKETSFSKFIIDNSSEVASTVNQNNTVKQTTTQKPKETTNSIKKSMKQKRNLFEM